MDSFDFSFLCLPLPTSYFYSKPVFNAYCHPPSSSAGSLSRGTEPSIISDPETWPAGLFEHHLKDPLAQMVGDTCTDRNAHSPEAWISGSPGLSDFLYSLRKEPPPTISPPISWLKNSPQSLSGCEFTFTFIYSQDFLDETLLRFIWRASLLGRENAPWGEQDGERVW